MKNQQEPPVRTPRWVLWAGFALIALGIVLIVHGVWNRTTAAGHVQLQPMLSGASFLLFGAIAIAAAQRRQ